MFVFTLTSSSKPYLKVSLHTATSSFIPSSLKAIQGLLKLIDNKEMVLHSASIFEKDIF